MVGGDHSPYYEFYEGMGHMIARKHGRELRKAQRQLEKVFILLQKDLRNITLREDAARFKMVVCKDEYIARGA